MRCRECAFLVAGTCYDPKRSIRTTDANGRVSTINPDRDGDEVACDHIVPRRGTHPRQEP